MNGEDDSIDWVALGAAMQRRRTERDLSVETVAAAMCLNPRQIFAIEAGEPGRFPSPGLRAVCAVRYAAYLDVPFTTPLDQPQDA